MNRTSLCICGAIAATAIVPGYALADTDLVCTGTFTGTILTASGFMNVRPIDSEIKIHLSDTTGMVVLPAEMVAAPGADVKKSDTDKPLKSLTYTDDTITADVSQGWGKKLELNIDRITGHIAVRADSLPLFPGQFAGTCEKYDPANTVKRF